MTIEDIQNGRFDVGAIVYNTNNNRFAIVLDGDKGADKDPCSVVVEQSMNGFIIHTPPNRALMPTGRHVDFNEILRKKDVCERRSKRWLN